MALSGFPEIMELENPTISLKKEILKIAASMDLERRKYKEYKIIKDVALECANSDCGLSPELQSKVYNILMFAEVEQSLELTNQCILLGLDPTSNVCLTHEEKEQLGMAVQQGLMEKHRNLIKDLGELGIMLEEDCSAYIQFGLSSSNQEKEIVVYKQQLNEKQDEYGKKLREFTEVLEQLINLKVKVLPPVANHNIQVNEVEGELLRLKTQIFSMRAKQSVFAETNNSLDAYKQLVKDIKNEQAECKVEIEKLQGLKEQYKLVSCKQYDEILKSYLCLKSAIEKKLLLGEKPYVNNI